MSLPRLENAFANVKGGDYKVKQERKISTIIHTPVSFPKTIDLLTSKSSKSKAHATNKTDL